MPAALSVVVINDARKIDPYPSSYVTSCCFFDAQFTLFFFCSFLFSSFLYKNKALHLHVREKQSIGFCSFFSLLSIIAERKTLICKKPQKISYFLLLLLLLILKHSASFTLFTMYLFPLIIRFRQGRAGQELKGLVSSNYPNK
jgi:hypothetical protein